MVRPLVISDSPPNLSLTIFIDYQTGALNNSSQLVAPDLAEWDECDWDECDWADALRLYNVWAGVAGIGHRISLYVAGAAEDLELQWKSTDFLYEYGNLV